LTHFGKSQIRTSNQIDTAYEKKLIKIVLEHRNLKNIIIYKDSIIIAQNESLQLLGLQFESCMVSNKILELDSDQKSQVISQCFTDKEILKSENETLQRKLKRQKRLKWVFGGVGFIAGVFLMVL
jgi:hypothetical protein